MRNNMKNWLDGLRKKSIFFITPDVKRGIGLDRILPNYHIICAYTDPLIPILRKQGAHIFCLEENQEESEEAIKNSGKLLEHPRVSEYIKRFTRNIPAIMYFKPSLKLDFLIEKNGYRPIGNKSNLNEQFENKIEFFQFLGKHLQRYCIAGETGILSNFHFTTLTKKYETPFVVQFGHGWAGKTTFFINHEDEFADLVKKFPQTKAKVSQKIEGYTVLNNCCIYGDAVLVSQPAIQVNNVKELSSQEGVTCGRQWPVQFLGKAEIDQIKNISQTIGILMRKTGFTGFFGLDFLIGEKSRRIYISEVNARLTASSAFFTRRQLGEGVIPLEAYHMGSFLQISLPILKEETHIIGSQIIFRDPSRVIDSLFSQNYGVFKVINDQPQFLKSEYAPEKLTDKEILFMKRYRRGKEEIGDEISRIETKQEVLEKPGKLALWLKNLFRKSIQERRS